VANIDATAVWVTLTLLAPHQVVFVLCQFLAVSYTFE
jgi:hypothetical protein